MDDPHADTEWNDILRARGILPPKPEPEEEMAMTIEQPEERSLDDLSLDELDELEDLEDDRILEEYRRKRLEEMKELAETEKFSEVIQISKPDFVREVTEASQQCAVILHLFKDDIPLCKLMNRYLSDLAQEYKSVKFCKIIGDQCIPNYPERNVPTLLIYINGELQSNLVGPATFGGMKMTLDSLRDILRQHRALPAEDKKKTKAKTTLSTTALSSEDEAESDDGYY